MGTVSLTIRGFKEKDMHAVAELIDRVVRSKGDEAVINQVKQEVREMCKKFPLPH